MRNRLQMRKTQTELNTKIQGKENLLTSEKMGGFRSKLTLWCTFVEQCRLEMFLLCSEHSNSSTLSLSLSI